MTNEKEMTAPSVSVGADTEQSLNMYARNIIPDESENSNGIGEDYDEMVRDLERMTDPSYIHTVTMSALYDKVFDLKSPLIEGLLNRGTYLFAGSPKVGKSFLMAQLAVHISTGTPIWGYPVRQSPVLYLALEDDYPRLQQRLYRMFGEQETKELYLATQSRRLGEGLEEQIRNFTREHPGTGLIIIDTLKRIREKDSGDYSYGSDYDVVSRLKTMADSYGISLIIVHHTRKQAAEDKFDMISGTNGLLGAADGAFILSKNKRTDHEAVLEITGRDQQDQRLYLVRNEQRLIWELDHVESDLWKEPPEPILEAISQKLDPENPVWQGSPTELAQWLDTDLPPNALSLKLNINAARLANEYGISYRNRRTHDGRRITLQRNMVQA